MNNKKIFSFFLLLLTSSLCTAQLICKATADTGSAYTAISNSGFELETPDCIDSTFGAHVTQIYDAELDRNVFVFHSHIEEDNDRCLVFDRVRMEIKGGPNSDQQLQHPQNDTSYYRWKFRLATDFTGASTFCHIFQNKAYGGSDSGFPIITITPRASILEVRHNGGDTGVALGVLAQADLNLFKGKWVEGYLKQVHSENGALEITIKDVITGQVLLAYNNDDIDLWRADATYNRPKWGIYRAKGNTLKDEEIRFADFCVSEIGSNLCPGEAGLIDTVNQVRDNSQNDLLEELSIFPNPVSGQLQIKLVHRGKGLLTIYGMDGQLIKNKMPILNESNLEVSSWAKGNYLLILELENEKTLRRQFTVE